MNQYEVEVKALLGSAERAEAIRKAMKKVDASCALISKNKQLNHYFEIDKFFKDPIHSLASVMRAHLPEHAIEKLKDMAARAKQFSLRSRNKDGEALLVVKASVDETTSENGIARIEFEEKFPQSFDYLDELILTNGFRYQAKWSREREEYMCRGVNVTLDKNAGYGWLAEFERIVEDEVKVEAARNEIRSLMKELEVEELAQDRLERMFAYYNAHWPEYYGTEKIFVIE
ncbi:CYTH domain-containing protein [Candidatus Kaiserbacteria bacterium]|nr:CYTH domain-containing protein [Candidatus Kaiserbacteria bacterium]